MRSKLLLISLAVVCACGGQDKHPASGSDSAASAHGSASPAPASGMVSPRQAFDALGLATYCDEKILGEPSWSLVIEFNHRLSADEIKRVEATGVTMPGDVDQRA